MRSASPYEEMLKALVRGNRSLVQQLEAGRSLNLSSWCIGAGTVRNLVWDHLSGAPSAPRDSDVDFVYFDVADLSAEQESRYQSALRSLVPNADWEVVNQARVHHWYADAASVAATPLASLLDGISTWPEYATCVGVSLDHAGDVAVLAPHGLDDLFSMVVRWNPTRASREVFRERVAAKRFAVRWPRLQVVQC